MLGRSLLFDTLGLMVMTLGFLLLTPICVIVAFGVTLLVTHVLGGAEVTFGPGMVIFMGAVLLAAGLAPPATRPLIDRLGVWFFRDRALGTM